MSSFHLLTLSPHRPPPPLPPPPPPPPPSKFTPPPPRPPTFTPPPHPPTNFNPLIQKIYTPYHIYKHPSALLLEQCTSTAELHRILPLIYKHGFYHLPLFQTKLVSLFCRFDALDDAARVFDPIVDKMDVLYHTMLKGYAKGALLDDAFALYCRMVRDGVEPMTSNYAYLLKACGDGSEIKRGREIHGNLIVRGFGFYLVVLTAVVNMYAKCGRVEDAYKVFDSMPAKDLVAWNAIIAGYAQNGYAKVALELLIRMQEEGWRPDWITIVSVLPASADMGSSLLGKSLHGYAMRAGFDSFVNVSTALLDMYSKFGAVWTARSIFDAMDVKTVITWNSMIDGYVQIGNPEEALNVFRRMLDEGVELTNVTIMEALYACTDCGDLESGKFIHGLLDQMGLGSDVPVVNSLISMHNKCKNVDVATELFHNLQNKTRDSWNAMVSGFSQNGHVKEALSYFCNMFVNNVRIDSFTLNSIIPALAELCSPRRAKWIHGIAVRSCLYQNVFVMTALVDMYAKCGDVQTARKLCDMMDERRIMTWNAMIEAYGTHGLGASAMELFTEMQKGSVKPDEITFLCVLAACSHSGLVEEGRGYFDMMREEYFLKPTNDHYGAMVDLLGRAGLLEEAWYFIENMPIKPGISVPGALLGACKMHNNVELAEKAAKMLVDLDPNGGGYHMLLANVYSTSWMWDKVAELRSEMDIGQLNKILESSFMELGNEFHTFNSGSTDHPQSKEIFAYLDTLLEKIKAAGYVPDHSSIHDDVEEDVQKQPLSRHSEKLAIAFGLLNTNPGDPLHIRKNLRICKDCHRFTKYIALVTGREIVVRDMHRLHHFCKNGTCSCRDYW